MKPGYACLATATSVTEPDVLAGITEFERMRSIPTTCTWRLDRTWDGQSVPAVEQVSCRIDTCVMGVVEGEAAHVIEVRAPFHADQPAPNGAPGVCDGLWEYEVVEVFLAGADMRPYFELEMSPHGHCLALRFDDYRHRAGPPLALSYAPRIEGTHWTGRAVVPASLLGFDPSRGNVCAIHGPPDRRRYLALAHAATAAQPDYHRMEALLPLRARCAAR